MIRDVLRHWVLIDLDGFRKWITAERLHHARLIDNQDGSYGRAFDVRSFDAGMIIAASETMRTAIAEGMNAVEPLSTGRPRVLRRPPSLAGLAELFGGVGMIPPDAWAAYDRAMALWKASVRDGSAEGP